MFESLIELVMHIWRGDTEIRESSLMGQSEMDRKSGKAVAWICGALLAALVLAGVAWAWFIGISW